MWLDLRLQMRLMAPPNTTWQQILAQARANPELLKQTVGEAATPG